MYSNAIGHTQSEWIWMDLPQTKAQYISTVLVFQEHHWLIFHFPGKLVISLPPILLVQNIHTSIPQTLLFHYFSKLWLRILCVCLWGLICVCTDAFWSQMLRLNVFLVCSQLYFQRQVLLLSQILLILRVWPAILLCRFLGICFPNAEVTGSCHSCLIIK